MLFTYKGKHEEFIINPAQIAALKVSYDYDEEQYAIKILLSSSESITMLFYTHRERDSVKNQLMDMME